MEIDFDTSDLDDFIKSLNTLNKKEIEKKSNKFLKKEASKLKRRTKKNIKKLTRQKTGNLYKSPKTSKVYKDEDKPYIKVLTEAPHGHLLEFGHNITKIKKGPSIGYVKGVHFLRKSTNEFRTIFKEDSEKFIDDTIRDTFK